MAKSFSFGSADLVASADTDRAPAVPDAETPFRILVLGDFRGKTGSANIGRPLIIDRDNFDDVMAKLGVALKLTVGNDPQPIALTFNELEDFHPDRIYERAEVFQALRKKRRDLNDPATFAEAARSFAKPAEPVVETTLETPAADPANLLDQIIAKTSGVAWQPSPPQPKGDFDRFLERLIAPYGVAAKDPRQDELVASVDRATSGLMRDVLHDPDFQACEAAWRGLFFLTRRLDTDVFLTISVCDISQDVFTKSVVNDDPLATSFHKALIEPTLDESGEPPWAVIVGAYTFGLDAESVATLERITGLARLAGAPFLAAAGPSFLGVASIAEHPDPDDWKSPADLAEFEALTALRRSARARYLGLALPRFLLRLPYGKNDRPIDAFAFEELSEGRRHEDFLWGNPAFVLAELLGRAFTHRGWSLEPGGFQEVEGLPLHVDRSEGEATPCAEAWLSVRAAENLLDRGLMPLLSIRGRDAIRLGRFQSVAEPAAALSGKW